MSAMPENLHLQRLSGSQINPCLLDLARLRIQVFREFPYLYQGREAYEQSYLKTYVDAPDSVMVVVWDGNTVVGASSGLPLTAEPPEVIQPLLDHGLTTYQFASNPGITAFQRTSWTGKSST